MKSIFLILLSLHINLYGQEIPPPVQQHLEDKIDEQEEIEDDAAILQWELYKKHPLNINTISAEDLVFPGLMSQWQLDNLVSYRKLFGDLINIYELQAVPGFDLHTIKKILPFIKVESSHGLATSLAGRLKKGRQLFMLRLSRTLQTAGAYNRQLPVHFLGDGNHVLFRYRFQERGLQFGILGEKDAGEKFFGNGQKAGFDFYSFHIFIKDLGKIRTIALGDYVLNLGQGLIHWQSMAGGRGTQIINLKREAPVILPYRSAGEFNFLRGGAVEFEVKKTSLTVFASFKKISASTNDSLESFSAFNSSGLHRTLNEVNNKNNLGLLTMGGRLQRKFTWGRLGLHAVNYFFSQEIKKRELPYNLFAPKGRTFNYIGFDHSATLKNLHFFGELAFDQHLHWALTQGMLISADNKVDLAILYRKFSDGYNSLFGNSFMENSFPGNEEGAFAGILIRPVKSVTISAFADVFRHSWLKYRTDAPSKGMDQLLSLEYQPSRNSSITILYRSRNKASNQEFENFDHPVSTNKRSVRIHCSSQVSSAVTIRSRFEKISFKKWQNKIEHGNMFYVEGIYSYTRFQLSARFQFFDTESFDTRIYSYEPGVLYKSSTPAVQDKGLRFYINGRFEIKKEMNISVHFASTILPAKTSVGSSYTAVNGNKKEDISIQFSTFF